jgi:hypothetical protein
MVLWGIRREKEGVTARRVGNFGIAVWQGEFGWASRYGRGGSADWSHVVRAATPLPLSIVEWSGGMTV